MQHFVYADNAATTPISEPVFEAMLPWLREGYGNPSGIYEKGRQARRAVETARMQIAQAIGAQPADVFFTSGGSESNNWAIIGAARKLAGEGKRHIVTTTIEHPSVLRACEALEQEGFEITYLPVGENGVLDADVACNAVRKDTALVSVMAANNEIGTIQPVEEIAAYCREREVWFHTDAVQAVGNLEIDVQARQFDMLSLSGHKLHAPKGVGVLYIRKGIVLQNLIWGGSQERGRRAGTENVASIVGLGCAVELACQDIAGKAAHMLRLREQILDALLALPNAHLSGDREQRLPGNINICFSDLDAEELLYLLDQQGVCASSGSACSSGSLDPSHVLLALGLTREQARGALRLSIASDTTQEDAQHIIQSVTDVVQRLRGTNAV